MLKKVTLFTARCGRLDMDADEAEGKGVVLKMNTESTTCEYNLREHIAK
jgi:hypothetical protein